MAFFLFILVNAVLLIRPTEIVTELQGIELYFYLIVACALFSATDVLRYLTGTSLEKQPITLCVLGVLACVLVAPLVSLNLPEAWRTGFYFFKVVIYFLLLVSLVTTPARLLAFTRWVVVFFCVVMVLAILN